MALKSTILKAQVSLSDMDRHYYQELSLTIAQHPSENAQRLMVRLLAYLLNADSDLEFTKGLCADDEPEIWRKSLSGEILLWVELGLPDEKRLKKAANQAQQVLLYTYGDSKQQQWWQKNQRKLASFSNVSVFSLDIDETQALSQMLARNMQFTVTVQDTEVWFASESHSVVIQPKKLQ